MKYALELGCGDLKEANNLKSYEVIAIDRKISGVALPHVKPIEADYFDVRLDREFDLVYANYSLCFNTKQRIQEKLPLILSHLKKEGSLIIKDFSAEERTVLKKTNLDSEWFFTLLIDNVGKILISRKKIVEKEHNHTHQVLIINNA